MSESKTAKPKSGRFYEIRKQLGDKPYELTEDISIKPMDIARRNVWRKASYESLTANIRDAISVDRGVVPDYVDYHEQIERALLGDQYDEVKALFADDARAWDLFLNELRDFNKVDGTALETAAENKDAEGNGNATPESSQ
ncbi:hypothetical protein [Mycolicibacterium llatzerense]|uniref:Uncharacterized protein n=1 Tax=Mycolicibacterium llatzerense TaxID=280871 RepID=A0A0D1LIL5_9MYCO|nr:hypothetical protein [Mycolicibacterium llatzerense]KIU18322.1 hypothetical protein TL10_02410 [Mycolicibacterium llatzerense]